MRRTRSIFCGLVALLILSYGIPVHADEDPRVDPSLCRLSPVQAPWEPLVEGPTERSSTVPSVGSIVGLLLFVDFSDAPATRTTSATFDLLAPETAAFYEEVSHGRLDVSFEGTETWIRMPKTSATYEAMTNKYDAYLKDAVAAADAQVDFSEYDMTHLIFSEGSGFRGGGAFLLPPYWQAPTNDGVTVKLGSFLSDDPSHRWKGLMHEMGHDIGMPDLYDFSPEPIAGYQEYLDWRQHFVGGWDPMSRSLSTRHFLAWHKWKNGWIDDDQIVCVGGGTTEVTVSPLETDGGIKAIVVPFADSKAFVLEVRRAIGSDSTICDEGALIYTVESGTHVTFPNGSGPVRVVEAQPSGDASKRTSCADLYNAPFDLAPGEVASYQDPVTGISFEITSSDGSNMTVEVTDPGTYLPPKPVTEMARTVSLSLKKKTGTIRVSSLTPECEAGDAVLEKKTGSGWRELATVALGASGVTSVPIKKAGTYRASIAELRVEGPAAVFVCASAVSSPVRKK